MECDILIRFMRKGLICWHVVDNFINFVYYPIKKS